MAITCWKVAATAAASRFNDVPSPTGQPCGSKKFPLLIVSEWAIVFPTIPEDPLLLHGEKHFVNLVQFLLVNLLFILAQLIVVLFHSGLSHNYFVAVPLHSAWSIYFDQYESAAY